MVFDLGGGTFGFTQCEPHPVVGSILSWSSPLLSIARKAAPAFAAGFFAGYLAYDMTHYYLHHFRPRSRLGRRLRELHMRHHFQDDTRGFGVSAPWWDHAFGTAPRSRRGEH